MSTYNGNQFVPNKSTDEIHGLDNESIHCQINKMNQNIYQITQDTKILRYALSF